MDACHALIWVQNYFITMLEVFFVAELIRSCSVVDVGIIFATEVKIIFAAGIRVALSTRCSQSL